MTIKTYREAVKEALAQEMERDERVVLIGEDLRGGHGGNAPEEAKIEAFGGVLGVTKGLWTQFGSDRVIDTPITESAIIGMAAGAAAKSRASGSSSCSRKNPSRSTGPLPWSLFPFISVAQKPAAPTVMKLSTSAVDPSMR